ncbi:hypothetical protein JCM17960_12330 [Magnetospira thiophila]
MKPQTVLSLAVAAVVSATAATFTLSHYAGPEALRTADPGPVLPGMSERLGELAVITVENAHQRVTLRRAEGLWGIEQRDGFTADPTKVRDLVLGLERLRKLEPRTRLARNHDRLHLSDLKAKDSQAHRLTLIDLDGHIIAGLMVGKRNYNIGDGGLSGVYVRTPESDDTWLARGELPFSANPVDWMDRLLVNLAADGIDKFTLFHPQDDVIILTRDPINGSFMLENTPSEAGAPHPEAIAGLVGSLDLLLFDDVQRADRIPFDPDGSLLIEVQSRAGPLLRITIAPYEGAHWARLSLGPDLHPDSSPNAERQRLREAVRRADGWLFRIPESVVRRLDRKMADLVDLPE